MLHATKKHQWNRKTGNRAVQNYGYYRSSTLSAIPEVVVQKQRIKHTVISFWRTAWHHHSGPEKVMVQILTHQS